jgi:cob(I)alamin adenosyltransferase
MKIYTRTGDNGDTSLSDGRRTAKSSLRIDANGTIDELNAQIGVVRALKPPAEIGNILEKLQSQLLVICSDIAAPLNSENPEVRRINQDQVIELEKEIDRLDFMLKPINSFILPGGQLISAQLHVARTICRRAERIIDALGRNEDIGKFPLVYLNRLSDLLFVLARYADMLAGTADNISNDCSKSDN